MRFQLTAMLTIKNYWQNMEYKLLTVRKHAKRTSSNLEHLAGLQVQV